MKRDDPIKHNIDQVRTNIKTIRHYLELNKVSFAESCGIGVRRYLELETRYVPGYKELHLIAKTVGLTSDDLIFKQLKLQLCVK